MISYDDKSGIFKLTTANTAYAFQIVGGKYPVHLYYGKKLAEKGLEKLREGNIYGASVYYAEPGMGFSSRCGTLGNPLVRGCGDFRTPRLGFLRRTALAISFSPLKIILPQRESPFPSADFPWRKARIVPL